MTKKYHKISGGGGRGGGGGGVDTILPVYSSEKQSQWLKKLYWLRRVVRTCVCVHVDTPLPAHTTHLLYWPAG